MNKENRFTIFIDPLVMQAAKVEALKKETTPSRIVEQALRDYFRKPKKAKAGVSAS